MLPFTLSSVPLAVWGARWSVSSSLIMTVMALTLAVAGIYLLVIKKQSDSLVRVTPSALVLWPAGLIVGGGLGFISGLIGIGGGIFLSPILYFLKWGGPKEIAAASSFFILVNSISGLGGHLVKPSATLVLVDYIPLFAAVLIGSQGGGLFSARQFPQDRLRWITAGLVIIASARITLTLFQN
jgi:uncharacterized membrane protein YfcA